MKKKKIWRVTTLILLFFSLTVVPISCADDDSDPMDQVDPDADGDGVADKDDTCPNEAGLAALDGCPDTDSDGVADKDDACPNEAGVAALDGCPEDAMESVDEIGTNLLRINAGGPEVTIGTDIWETGVQYLGGAIAAYEAHPSITEIENTDLDEIYLTETITSNDSNKGPVSYDIPVSNGTYTVKLHFAEIYWGVQKTDAEGTEGGEGSRVFEVDIEEMSILNKLDVFQVTGGAAIAFTRMYDIEVSDGELNIVFTSSVDKPKVSAIEIFGDGTINP